MRTNGEMNWKPLKVLAGMKVDEVQKINRVLPFFLLKKIILPSPYQEEKCIEAEMDRDYSRLVDLYFVDLQ